MKANRLWPVLTVLCVLVIGVGSLEWAAAHREGYYDQIIVADSTGAEDDSEEVSEVAWQATTPKSPEHARARQLLRRGEVDDALAIYETLVGDESPSVQLLTEYGYALRRARRCQEANVVIGRALARAPGDAAVNFAAALTHRCLGHFEEAAVAFERTLELRPNHTTTRLAHAQLLWREGELTRAIEVLEPASRRGSNEERARALALLGRCLFERGERARARRVLDEAIQRAPAFVAIWMSVSRTYLRSDERDDHVRALHHATRASRLAPELATPHSALGRAYEKLGMRLEAIDSYSRAAALDPGYAYVRTRLVRLSLEEEEYALARRSARGLLQIDPEQAEYHFLHGLASARSGDVEAARASYMESIRLREGGFAEAWFNLGILEREADQPEAAKEAYQRALEARPSYEQAWNNLGLVHLDLDEFFEAEAAFRRAIALREDYSAPWINVGRTYAEVDRYDLAAVAYERALQITPSNRTVRLRLAVAYRRTGRSEQAIRLYRGLVEDAPRYVSAWYNLGIALAAAGRNMEAQQAYQTALGIDPNHRRALKNLGLLEARMGHLRLAWSYLTDALDRDPTDYEVRLRLAQLSFGNNDLDRCAREARVVLVQTPDNEEARTLLGTCTQRSQ